MGDWNFLNNRIVWIDIPVANLDRAMNFYSKVLAIKVSKENHKGCEFAFLDHKDGNGGCLCVNPADITDKGSLNYLNVDGRLEDAVARVKELGGKVLQEIHQIGPYGFRAVVLDSEGNRIGLHSRAR
jgi:predicted enzyme related to lactoylglutathione lyase